MEVENQAIESDVVVAEQPIIETESSDEVDVVETEDNIEEQEASVEGEQEGDDDNDELFPKKATRALERRNKKINKLRTQNAELERRMAELESRSQLSEQIPNESDVAGLSEPQEDDFEDYATYLEAKGEYKARKEFAGKEVEAQQRREFESQQQWVQQRAKYVDDRAAEAAKTIPELDGMYRENQDIIEGYSNEAKMAFLEADAPELAFYALATEGRLEELDTMTPTKIAREIALAEIRGEKLTKKRPVSNAPAPIKKPRGSGTRSKSLADMSPKELLNHIQKSKRN